MMLTRDFSRAEFLCPCNHCNGGMMDEGFMQKLQLLRTCVDFPFRINSGYRCHEHNIEVGGKPDSYHLKGRAADIAILIAEERQKILACADMFGLNGVGVGMNFIHLDDREIPARWTYP